MLSVLAFICSLVTACGGVDADSTNPPANGGTVVADAFFTRPNTALAPATSVTAPKTTATQVAGTTPTVAQPAVAQPAVSDGSLAWSNPDTWGGNMPPAGAEVVIPAGKVISLDVSPPALAGLRIEGTLRFARTNVTLTAGYIDLTGALEIGTAASPFTQKAVITLNGTPVANNDGASRGLNVRGGRIELHGAVPTPVWTKLNDHANAGASSLALKDSVNWKAGDTIAVAPTDFYGVAATERFTLASASGANVALASPLAKFRWGKLQYVTADGMSLTPDASYVPPALPAPTVLDERAAVGNLTRNIVIQGADDAAWKNQGFGAHLMIMNLASKVTIDGVEFRRSGQAGVTGRYPIHWHLLSYTQTGQLMGDAIGHVVRNSAIWNSANRCVVIHGTNGVQVLNNICQDVKGHAFFLEDAVERRNVFDGNLALTVRSPTKDQILQVHERSDDGPGGPSGFWLTNPDNKVTNNLAGDAAGNGFWMAFPRHALGLSSSVAMLPDRLAHTGFENNTAHSNLRAGLMLALAPVDAAGNVGVNMYIPTVDGAEDKGSNRQRFTLKRVTSYKNSDGAYRNTTSWPDYLEWVAADNTGTYFEGKVDDGQIARGLIVGYSLNSLTPYPKVFPFEPPAAFATYHSMAAMRDNTLVNFPFVEGQPSGAFRTTDYYVQPVDKGLIRNGNNRLTASSAGYRTPPPNMDGKPAANRNWTLAGALWDTFGYWGSKGNYWVHDVPFLTAGANCHWVEPAGKNGKSCDGPYYGVLDFQTDFDDVRFLPKAPIEVVRQDSNGGEIGRWTVGDGATSTMLGNMRHFAARQGGRYVLRYPGKPLAKRFAMTVNNASQSGDYMVFGVSFDGAITASGYTLSGYANSREKVEASWFASPAEMQKYVRTFTPASSLAEVVASNGDRIWQDRANNMVWVRIQGGMAYPGESRLPPNSDDDLYRPLSVVLTSK